MCTKTEELGSDLIIPLCMPTIQAKIRAKHFSDREAGLLALGAMAVSCGGAFALEHLHILSLVIPHLHDEDEMVRCVAFWSLGRVAEGLLISGDPNLDTSRLFDDLLPLFEAGMKDAKSTKVQSAAASGLADVIESLPHDDLMDRPSRLFELAIYWLDKTPNLPGPYDIVGTLLEVMPADSSVTIEYVCKILPMLLDQWEKIADDGKSKHTHEM